MQLAAVLEQRNAYNQTSKDVTYRYAKDNMIYSKKTRKKSARYEARLFIVSRLRRVFL